MTFAALPDLNWHIRSAWRKINFSARSRPFISGITCRSSGCLSYQVIPSHMDRFCRDSHSQANLSFRRVGCDFERRNRRAVHAVANNWFLGARQTNLIDGFTVRVLQKIILILYRNAYFWYISMNFGCGFCRDAHRIRSGRHQAFERSRHFLHLPRNVVYQEIRDAALHGPLSKDRN